MGLDIELSTQIFFRETTRSLSHHERRTCFVARGYNICTCTYIRLAWFSSRYTFLFCSSFEIRDGRKRFFLEKLAQWRCKLMFWQYVCYSVLFSSLFSVLCYDSAWKGFFSYFCWKLTFDGGKEKEDEMIGTEFCRQILLLELPK